MTALNCVLTSERAFIIQDAAIMDRDGVVIEIRSKPIHFPAMGGVIASAGPSMLASCMKTLISAEFGDIDALAAGADEFFQDIRRHWRSLLEQEGWPEMSQRTVVVGWSSEQMRPRCVVFSDSLDVVVDVDAQETISPMVPEDDLLAYFRKVMASGGRERFDPVVHGLTLVQRQRLQPIQDVFDAVPQYGVGGFVEVAEVTAKGVSRSIIHRWLEDVIGEPIRPEGGNSHGL